MAHKFKLYFFLALVAVSFASCRKDDDGVEPLRDYSEQYAVDLDSIEEYLETHYLTVTETNGLMDVTVTKIPSGGTQTSIMNDERLTSMEIKNMNRNNNLVDGRVDDPVNYKVYYMILNEGGGDRPTSVDSVYCSYRGWELDNEEFDRSDTPFWSTFPAITSSEVTLISGFREFVPKLRAATHATDDDEDGNWTFHNAGVGVVFLPSGLAYYNATSGSIGAYSPLVFLIRLNKVKPRDHDFDRVPSNLENIGMDGTVQTDLFKVDTDGDNIPDFLDIDDDNDTFGTKRELRINDTEPYQYYAFDQIPACGSGTTKRHRDSSCH